MDERERIMKHKGTEAPFSSTLLKEKRNGDFACGQCSQTLFSSKTKFNSGTGWPSFNDAVEGAVEFKDDSSLFMKRTEVICRKCHSHLGHIFNDGPKPTGKRYCINGCALDFVPK